MNIPVQKLHPAASLPRFGSAGAAGADLCALFGATLQPGETALIRTGLALAIPAGFGGFVFARSGLASKRGLAPANKVGVIDSDYRGELLVALYNQSGAPQTVEAGERIAQLVLLPVPAAAYLEADTLEETPRGAGGFGSTGSK